MSRYRRETNGESGRSVSRCVAGAICGPGGGSASAIDRFGFAARCAANARIKANAGAG